VTDTDVEGLDTIRVGQGRAGASLVQEHADELLLLCEMRQNALDRDDLLEALEPGALGAIHLRHAPRGNPFDDSVSLLLLGHAGRTSADRQRKVRREKRSRKWQVGRSLGRLPPPCLLAGQAAERLL